MLQQLMGLQQQQQQIAQGAQGMQFAPQEQADKHAVSQGQAQHYADESAQAPYNQAEAQFQQQHRQEQFDTSSQAAQGHSLASLIPVLGMGGMSQPEIAAYTRQKMGLHVDPQTQKRALLEQIFPGDTAHINKLMGQ